MSKADKRIHSLSEWFIRLMDKQKIMELGDGDLASLLRALPARQRDSLPLGTFLGSADTPHSLRELILAIGMFNHFDMKTLLQDFVDQNDKPWRWDQVRLLVRNSIECVAKKVKTKSEADEARVVLSQIRSALRPEVDDQVTKDIQPLLKSLDLDLAVQFPQVCDLLESMSVDEFKLYQDKIAAICEMKKKEAASVDE